MLYITRQNHLFLHGTEFFNSCVSKSTHMLLTVTSVLTPIISAKVVDFLNTTVHSSKAGNKSDF